MKTKTFKTSLVGGSEVSLELTLPLVILMGALIASTPYGEMATTPAEELGEGYDVVAFNKKAAIKTPQGETLDTLKVSDLLQIGEELI